MWKTVKLGDVCKLNYGKSLDKKNRLENGIVPAYGANGIKVFTNKPLYDEPSIIIGRKGSAGELNKITEPFWALDVTYYVTTDKTFVDLDFLFYTLTVLNLPSLARGVKPGINRNDVYSKLINLPPLAEQQRIVAKLDAAFAEIDTAIEVAEAKEAEVEKLKSSLLSDLLSGETLLSGLTPITELCEAIYAGGDAPPKEKISKVETDEFSVPIYSNGAKGAGLYGFTSFEPRTLKPAITISARGTIGHIEMRTRPFLPIVRLIVLEPKTAKVNLTFLKYALLNTEVFGSGSSIPQLTVPMLKKMNIVSPPLAEQQRIVAKLEAAFAEIDNAKQAIQRAKENHAALKSAILAQELTPPTESEAA